MNNPIDFSKKLFQYLKGELSDKEAGEIRQQLNEDEELRRLTEELQDKKFINRQLEHMQRFDVDEALRKVRSRQTPAPQVSTLSLRHLRYAVAIMVLVVGGAALWYSQYTKVTPPEISESVQLAMLQSKESGKMQADISEELSVQREAFSVQREESLVTVPGSQSDVDHSSLSILHSSLTKDQLMSARRITTWHDKEFWVTLDDGTLVHLNYNTRLIYPEKFGRGDRNVILDGEAYFMVAKDKSRPFVVHTPQGDVKVYGTEFNVNTRSNNSTTIVVLVKGCVSVRPTGGKEQRMKPGQQCEISSEECLLSTVNVGPYIAWNTGDFIFHGWTLRHIMDVMSKWYNVTVEFSSERIANQIFTGSFSRYDDIQSTIETIKDVTGHDITIINNHITIKE